MEGNKDIYRHLPEQFDQLLEAMAEMERRGEAERVEEMRIMLDRAAAKSPSQQNLSSESRRDRRARERREAKAAHKARSMPNPKFDDPAFRNQILSPLTKA